MDRRAVAGGIDAIDPVISEPLKEWAPALSRTYWCSTEKIPELLGNAVQHVEINAGIGQTAVRVSVTRRIDSARRSSAHPERKRHRYKQEHDQEPGDAPMSNSGHKILLSGQSPRNLGTFRFSGEQRAEPLLGARYRQL